MGSAHCISEFRSCILSIGLLLVLLISRLHLLFQMRTLTTVMKCSENLRGDQQILWHHCHLIPPCSRLSPSHRGAAPGYLLMREPLVSPMKSWWALQKLTAHGSSVQSFWGGLPDTLHKHYIDLKVIKKKKRNALIFSYNSITIIFYSHK